jgi:hypothetical protein
VLDSGGFTELSTYGAWTVGPEQYIDQVYRFREEIGFLEWCAPQDWMCEPFITEKTGLTVLDHQRRTVDNFLFLRGKAPELPFIPVVQGFTIDEYHRCVAMYRAAGIDLAAEPLVGVGSVCRRQGTGEAARIITEMAAEGLSVHGFGFKITALKLCGRELASADSMAWSFDARRARPLPGCTHKSCANCLRYALRWRESVARRCLDIDDSLSLFDLLV